MEKVLDGTPGGQPQSVSLIPARFRCLSGSALKVLAVVLMLVDHAAVTFLSHDSTVLVSLWDNDLTCYQVMRTAGRMSFPLFAFLLVEGFVHTHDRKGYGERLCTFALISEIPWNLLHNGTPLFPSSQNVFFTLFAGYVGLCLLSQVMERSATQAACAWGLIVLFVVAVIVPIDYGPRGFGLILVLYLLRAHPVPRAVVGSCVLNSPLYVAAAYVPIGLYNGRRGFVQGRVLQLLFYAIYPAHMLLFYYLRLRAFGA